MAGCEKGRGDPEIRHDGEGTLRVSGPVALRLDRQPPGRNHDADRVRIWIHAREQEQDFDTASG